MISSGIWLFSGKLILTLINFVVVLILARTLTPDAFGIIAAGQAIITICQGVIEASIGSYLIQIKDINLKIKKNTFTFTIILACFISIFLFCVAPALAVYINIPEVAEVIRILLIAFLLTSISNYSHSMLLREMRFIEIILIEIISMGIIRGGVSVYLSYNGYSYWAVIYAIILSSTIWSLMLIKLKPFHLGFRCNAAETKRLLQFSGAVGATNFISMLALKVDNFIVAAFFGKEGLGQYSRAYSVIDLTSALLGSVFRTLILTNISEKNRNESYRLAEAQKEFLVAHASAIICVWPIAVTSFSVAPEVILLLLGDQWNAAVPLFQILAVGMFFRMGYKVSSAFNIANGLVTQEAYRVAIFLLATMVSSFIGAKFGLKYVALGILVSLLINYTLLTLLSLKNLEIKAIEFVSPIGALYICVFFVCCITSIICDYLRNYSIYDIYLIFMTIICQLIMIMTIIFYLAKKYDTYAIIYAEVIARLKKN